MARTDDDITVKTCSTDISFACDSGARSIPSRKGLSCVRQALRADVSATIALNEIGASFHAVISDDAALEILAAAVSRPVMEAMTDRGSMWDEKA